MYFDGTKQNMIRVCLPTAIIYDKRVTRIHSNFRLC